MEQPATTARFETGHVGLNVSNLERSRNFYREAFGLDVMAESLEAGREFSFLSLDGRLVLTLWQQGSGAFDGAIPGLHHLSFQVPAIDDVREAEARLRKMNVRLIYDRIVPHGEGTQSGGIYFEDPDGIRLEIFAPTGAASCTAPTAGAPSCGFF